MISDEGITEEVTQCDANLAAHHKRVQLLQFHPTSEFTLASASLDNTVKIWDIQNETPKLSFDPLTKDPFCMEWNYDGSRLALITKEKKMHVFDPRMTAEAQSTQAHDNMKSQRLKWLGDSGHILTQGFNAFNERQYAIFDSRNLETPLTMKRLDNQNFMAWLHYDDSSRVLYVVNKQNNATQFFYYHDTSADGSPVLQTIDSKYAGTDYNRGICFLPKRDVNFMKNELERAIRHNGKSAEYVSFKVKRVSGAFQAELYPPSRAQDAALSIDEWLSGQNKNPVLIEFDPESAGHDESAKKRQHAFQKKVTENLGGGAPKKFQLEEDQELRAQATEDAVEEATKPLLKRISELEGTVAEQAALIAEL